jgi:hypothetical protein
MKSAIIISALCLALSGCAHHTPSVFEFYDACSSQPTFRELAACMKGNRYTQCRAANTCTNGGDAAVAYADALAAQVQSHEISDATARTKFSEYRIKFWQEADRNNAIIRAGEAAAPVSGPTTCIQTGNTTHCY